MNSPARILFNYAIKRKSPWFVERISEGKRLVFSPPPSSAANGAIRLPVNYEFRSFDIRDTILSD